MVTDGQTFIMSGQAASVESHHFSTIKSNIRIHLNINTIITDFVPVEVLDEKLLLVFGNGRIIGSAGKVDSVIEKRRRRR